MEEQLVDRYQHTNSDRVFTDLVRQNLDFVYSICRRKLSDSELAKDAAQQVFLLLSEKISTFRRGVILRGWLFQAAHHICQNIARAERRRQHYEEQAAREMEHKFVPAQSQWQIIEPELDDALASLKAADRDAVLLRYVDQMTLEEVGIALGISSDAANKRISRAVERLRQQFAKSGATIGVAIIIGFLTDKLVEAAPFGAESEIINHMISHSTIRSATAIPHRTVPKFKPHLGKPLKSGLPGTSLTMKIGIGLGCVALLGGAGFLLTTSLHGASAKSATSASQSTINLAADQGRVVGLDFHTVANASVELYHADEYGIASVIGQTKTDSKGNYRFGQVSDTTAGGYFVIADTGTALGVANFGGTICQIQPSTKVTFDLVDSDSKPVANVKMAPIMFANRGSIALMDLGADCPAHLIETSDASGRITFDGIPQGGVVTFAVLNPEKYVYKPSACTNLQLAKSRNSGEMKVPLELGASVDGKVTYEDSGLPAPNVVIDAQSTLDDQTSGGWGQATTDQDGHYHLRLKPAKYNIEVEDQSKVLNHQWVARAISGLDLTPGRKLVGQDMTLTHGAIITGKVIDEITGAAETVAQFGVYGPAHPRTSAMVGTGNTDSYGVYSIRVAPGDNFIYPMNEPVDPKTGAWGANDGKTVHINDGDTKTVDFNWKNTTSTAH